MALKSYCGVPGSGKTLSATVDAIRHYNKQNSPIKYAILSVLYRLGYKKVESDLKYYDNFPYKKINNVYSTYPILLDKKRKIYSNKLSLWDINNQYSFYPDSILIIDEVQLFADSDEYKDKRINLKLRDVAKFLQAHRHYGIKTIIFISQNPSRIFKKGRNICESYLKLRKVIKIPLLPFGIIRGTGYYDMDYYGKFIPRSREERKKLPFDYYKTLKFFNTKKIFSSYDSRYLSNYNYGKPLLPYGTFDNMKVDLETLKMLFENDDY